MIVYSIGLGPGDPELLTIKAQRALTQSDVVVVPQSDITGRSVARDIVLRYIPEEKTTMYYFPMNNDRADLRRRYGELAHRIKVMAEQGKRVSYVTMGDPSIFSTSNYLTERLVDAGLEVKHIPGISSINAASTLLSLPLCTKGESFGVYEMPGDLQKVEELINRHPTTVFMKVNKRLPVLIQAVRKIKPEHAYLARRLGLDGESVHNILNGEPPPDAAYLSVAIIRRAGDKGTA
ncbi:cobalt-precorrin-2 C(20)-methyltransferase [bacterium BMS3Bbin06]|nr:cobalt-precorrin-2 C(20)-methyltransferase [bacterium BMS3Abin08]GBE34327.1 cobalt-precorrin-2 C(20)-methyltransferase [bacterium BMS3Bbin06]HDO34973.1 precorrin-2 C(20)-methyltransferase [Nitrospirota bacterium]HDY72027.1 precorrin-2 C(20)-methyltransferase [Nitrospirota bacterium]